MQSESAWLISQLADQSTQAFAVRFLETNPELLDGWFPLLIQARLVTVPPQMRQEGGSLVEPSWPGGRILELAARRRLPGVVDALEVVPVAGPRTALYVMAAFLQIDEPSDVARLTIRAVEWLAAAPGSIYDVPGLAHKVRILLTEGYPREAGALFSCLLSYDKEPRYAGGREAAPTIDAYWVRYLMEHSFPLLAAIDPGWLSHQLELRLREVTEWQALDAEFAPPAFVPSNIFTPMRNMGGEYASFDELLAAALRDAALALAEASAASAAKLIHRWLGDHDLIFRRLALHLLSIKGNDFPELRDKAFEPERFSVVGYELEARDFLRGQFSNLPLAQRLEIEEWILSK